MFFGPIRAVVVDDNPVHLLTITNGLSAAGIPCSSHWFSRDSGELVPPPPEGGYEHLRLIFMDLNLQELTNPDAQTLFYVAVDNLKKIVSPNSGPYILVFWTQVTSQAAAVASLFFEEGRLEGIPHPLGIENMRKGPFLPVVGNDVESFKEQMQSLFIDMSKKTDQLKDEIARITQGNSLLSTLSGWETRATVAAAQAINSIGEHGRKDAAEHHTEVAVSISTVLGEIAYEAVGKEIAAESPAKALDAGMIEILVDQFSSSVEEEEYAKNVKAAIGPAIGADRVFRNPEEMAASLNTYFHVERRGPFKATDRGIVLAAEQLLTAEVLGKDPGTLLNSEFLQPVRKILAQRNVEDAQKAAVRAEINENLERLKAAAKLVLVEVGADCDHAQSKPRTLRYLVGLEVPAEFSEFIRDKNGKLVQEALQSLGPWDVNEGQIFLLVSCRRYWTWQQNKLPEHAQTKYRLRSSVVNKLLHHYTVWSNRPGIVEFRP